MFNIGDVIRFKTEKEMGGSIRFGDVSANKFHIKNIGRRLKIIGKDGNRIRLDIDEGDRFVFKPERFTKYDKIELPSELFTF